MIYIKLRTINVPATLTKKRIPVAKLLVDDLLKQPERGEISRFDFFPKLVTDTKRMTCDISMDKL